MMPGQKGLPVGRREEEELNPQIHGDESCLEIPLLSLSVPV